MGFWEDRDEEYARLRAEGYGPSCANNVQDGYDDHGSIEDCPICRDEN